MVGDRSEQTDVCLLRAADVSSLSRNQRQRRGAGPRTWTAPCTALGPTPPRTPASAPSLRPSSARPAPPVYTHTQAVSTWFSCKVFPGLQSSEFRSPPDALQSTQWFRPKRLCDLVLQEVRSPGEAAFTFWNFLEVELQVNQTPHTFTSTLNTFIVLLPLLTTL